MALCAQDTVMALQALASFAAMIYGSRASFNLNVNALIGSENHDFDPITSRNMLTFQIWEVKLLIQLEDMKNCFTNQYKLALAFIEMIQII